MNNQPPFSDFIIRGSAGRLGLALEREIYRRNSSLFKRNSNFRLGSLSLLSNTNAFLSRVALIASGNSVSGSSLEICNADINNLKEFLCFLEKESKLDFDDYMVYISSGGTVYGNGLEIKTENSPLNPQSFYAEGKIKQEQIVVNWCAKMGVTPIIFRIANAYSLNFIDPKGFVEKVIHAASNDSKISIFASLESTKQYGTVNDYAYWILENIREIHQNSEISDANRTFFNLFPSDSYSLKSILEIIGSRFKISASELFKELDLTKVNETTILNTVHDLKFINATWTSLEHSIFSIS